LFWETAFPNEFMDYHVAIIGRAEGTKITDLEQNWDGGAADGQKVKATDLDLAAERGGKIDIFRPQGPDMTAGAPGPPLPSTMFGGKRRANRVAQGQLPPVAPAPQPKAMPAPQVRPPGAPFTSAGATPWSRGPASLGGRP
jgi:hypothetical protein